MRSALPSAPEAWAKFIAHTIPGRGATQGEGVVWFDLAPDGKRVAVELPVATSEGPKPEHEVTFLFNFFDELRRRAPLGK